MHVPDPHGNLHAIYRRVGKIWETYWGSVAKRFMSHGRLLPFQADNMGNKAHGAAAADSASASAPPPAQLGCVCFVSVIRDAEDG